MNKMKHGCFKKLHPCIGDGAWDHEGRGVILSFSADITLLNLG
jgi:hypothetical protein